MNAHEPILREDYSPKEAEDVDIDKVRNAVVSILDGMNDDRNSQWWRRIGAIAIAVLGGSGAGYGGKWITDEPAIAVEESNEEHKRENEARDQKQDDAIGQVQNRQRGLARNQIDAEVLTVASTQYIVDVVKAGPRKAGSIEKPPSLQAAEKRTKAMRQQDAVDRRFKEWDAEDPLGESEADR